MRTSRRLTTRAWAITVAAFACVSAACGSDARTTSSSRPSALAPHASAGTQTAETSAPVSAPYVAPPGRVGRIETKELVSPALGVTKRFVVYLPAGYDEDTHRYPVVYMLHGLGGDETNWAEHGGLLEAARAIDLRAIVVMPDGDASFYIDSQLAEPIEDCLTKKPTFHPGERAKDFCVKTANYEKYMTRDLVGHVDATYRTIASKKGRGIGGLSMGGYGALVLGMRHTDLFAAVASHSGLDALLYAGPFPYRSVSDVVVATSRAEWGEHYPDAVKRWLLQLMPASFPAWKALDPISLAGSLPKDALALYIDCGERDDFRFQNHARWLHDVLTARGLEHTFEIAPGAHNFDFWKARLPKSLAFFAANLAAPSP